MVRLIGNKLRRRESSADLVQNLHFPEYQLISKLLAQSWLEE